MVRSHLPQRLTTLHSIASSLAHLFCLLHPWLQDPRVNWICGGTAKHRELRGLTSAGKSYRGLRAKGHLANKVRPSKRGNNKRRMSLSLRRYR